jgi:plasmid stabilization system protein ParE
MTSVRSLPEAEEELAEAAAYYEARQPGLGVELVLEMDAALATIADNPQAFPRWRDDRIYRKHVLRRFPYIVFYVHVPGDDDVLVVAIAHSKRRPGYWLSRMTDDR